MRCFLGISSTVPVPLIFVLICCLYLATLTSSYKNKNSWNGARCKRFVPLSCVTVFDNVVEESICKVLDLQVKLGGLGHSVFFRESPPRTSVEAVIHSILTSTGDESPIVEYWWREEWMNLEMHRDLDEKLALQQGPIRFPDHAHVLYLSVGEDVHGPTVVFHDSKEGASKTFDKITIVPAVSGRLLRFKGDMMHAVPRPPLAYLDPTEGGTNLELWTRRRPVDENDPELNNYRRSVLLFNTWTGAPPNEISQVPPVGTVEGYTLHRTQHAEGLDKCRPSEEWKKEPAQSIMKNVDAEDDSSNDNGGGNDSDRLIRLKIGLLGDVRRRERSERYLNLYAPASIKDSLISIGRQQATFPLSETP